MFKSMLKGALLVLLTSVSALNAWGQDSQTTTLRTKILEDLATNNSRQITAEKLRSVLLSSADAIDSAIDTVRRDLNAVFTTFSLGKSIGEYDASTGIAKVTATGATSTPDTSPAFADGQYFDVVKAGTRSITGASVAMLEGGKIIVRGTVWGYIPPSDAALKKTIVLDSNVDDLYKSTTGRLTRSLSIPLTYTRNQSTGAASTAGNMVQIKNADRSVSITGYTDQTLASLVTDMQTGVSSSAITKVQFDFTASAAVTLDPMIGMGYVAGSERIIYLWRPTGLVSYTKTNTSTFSQILAAGTAREYVMGDKCRMELVFAGSTVTLNLYKGTPYTLVATTNTTPSTFLPTGDFIVGSRGSMNFVYTLTTEQAGAIATTLTTATAYTDVKISPVQGQIDSVTVTSSNLLPPTLIDNSSYRNSDGTIAATTGTRRTENLIAVLPNTQYTLKGIRTQFVGNEYSANSATSANRVKPISTVESSATILNYTWTTDAATNYIGLNIVSNSATYDGKAMLVRGPTAPDVFEPYGSKYISATKLKGTLAVESEVAAMKTASVNLLAGGFTTGTTYRNSDGAIGSSATPAVRTTNLIQVLPSTDYTVVNFNTNFIGNEYSANSATTANRVRVIAPLLSGSQYSTYTFTTSPTTTYLGLNVVIGSVDTSPQAMLIQGRTVPRSFEAAGQKYINGANIRGQIPGFDLPNIYYSFEVAGFNDTEAGSTQGTGLFTVYCRYSAASQYYAGYKIGRVLNSTIRADLWRIVGADLYKWDGSAMVPQMISLLNPSESEFVWKEAGKTDFTGGYHGDELLSDIFFYANSIRITDLSANIPLTAASDFWYIQKSTMIETDNATTVQQCVHHKNTKFGQGGFTTKNRVIWSRPVNVSLYYPGLVTVSHNQSGIVYNEDYNYQTTTAPAVAVELFHSVGQHEINYFNTSTGLGAMVTSRITKAVNGSTDNTALYDSQTDLFVRDITNYAKYYRGLANKTTTAGEIWEGEATFKPYRK